MGGAVIGGHDIALSALTVLDAPAPVAVDAAAHAGFDSVTFRLTDGVNAQSYPLVDDAVLRRETLAHLNHHGLGVLDVEVVRLRDGIDVPALGPVLEVAAALGARHLLVINQSLDEARAAEAFGAICAQAQPYRLRPVLEFMAFTATRTAEDALRLVERAGHDGGGVLVDALHLSRSGGSPAELHSIVQQAPGRFPYAQLCDAPSAAPQGGRRGLYQEAVESRLLPGEGKLPLAEMVRALPAGIPLSIETPVAAIAHLSPQARAQRALDATRRLLGD